MPPTKRTYEEKFDPTTGILRDAAANEEISTPLLRDLIEDTAAVWSTWKFRNEATAHTGSGNNLYRFDGLTTGYPLLAQGRRRNWDAIADDRMVIPIGGVYKISYQAYLKSLSPVTGGKYHFAIMEGPFAGSQGGRKIVDYSTFFTEALEEGPVCRVPWPMRFETGTELTLQFRVPNTLSATVEDLSLLIERID